MHWLGPFLVTTIQDLKEVKLVQLDGELRDGWVNRARLKPFNPPKN